MPRLDLIIAQVSAAHVGAALSQRGRELLSVLAKRKGIECPLADWSPRGSGVPRHPALKAPYQASLSHSDKRVLAGMSNVPVGIDIEHTRARHAARLSSLVELLPEPDVKRAILKAKDPLAAFYRAWTLYEALYKLDSVSHEPPSSLLSTRLARLAPHGNAHAWIWQSQGWTISVASHAFNLHIDCLPELPFKKFELKRS
ncbi:4'-phosphopantetheinyl transferase superfamily protein [Halomonas sp. hl-4]|uniref:4'-phosphopantetheinyl transferase superfamily protein n=1 Tax=Halomonas sp. hl-4 TaxID=1761789 RepID=UPI000BB7643A|nr:4'-phosphopantetheinyl transferase superfamily protein [Halomonas sp. hl-4]SNY98269.1 Phosphopantetheinyl transferase [Halomonas sp. hl-4]